MTIVLANHPIAKAADLLDVRSKAVRLNAVAQFDPKVMSDIERKYFKDTEYFTRWNSELKVQTPFAAEFSVGYENNDGAFLNNEFTVPSNGLAYATIKLPLLSGLMFDDNRFNLREARLIAERNELDRQIMINELIYQASTSYTKWLYTYLDVQNYEQAVVITRQRLDNSIALFENGDIPAIDTLESTINYNSMRFGLIKSNNKLIKAKQMLDLFIWDAEMNPMTSSENLLPDQIDVDGVLDWLETEEDRLLRQDVLNLPPLALYDNKRSNLELKRRLIKEDLKPQLDLKYNTLLTVGPDNPISFNANDYKFGVNFSYPFFTRKTRAKLQINEVEQMEVDLAFKAKRLETDLKINNAIRQCDLLAEQIDLVQQNIAMNGVLLDAEREKFQIGESSIFLLNQRELKLLKARLDLNATEIDLLKQYFELRYLTFD
jgi:outer membrane protein TolC